MRLYFALILQISGGMYSWRLMRRMAVALAGVMVASVQTPVIAGPIAGDRPLPEFVWERASDLPNPIGLKGMYAGVSDDHVILAGGSNFPVPQRAGGRKVFSAQIFVRPLSSPPSAPWQAVAEALPVGLAEGAAVTTQHGVIGIGGQGETGPSPEVFILRWDRKKIGVQRSRLPDLPVPCANAAAVYLEGKLYVAGGETNGQGHHYFWVLDLAMAAAKASRATWVALPSWPGHRRFGAVLAVLHAEGREQLFLFGGRIKAVQPAALSDYLDDAYRYDPASREWTALARMPHPALLAASVRTGPSQLAVLGGSDGHDLERMAELGERYRLPNHIAIYDAGTDRWTGGGKMPLGVVGAAVVDLQTGWLVVGGEYSPGLRTADVYRLTLKTVPQPDTAR